MTNAYETKTKFYLAYGSNLNLRQMFQRCPDAELVGWTILKGWKLLYRGSRTGSYLSIEPAPRQQVYCGVFKITQRDEKALDRYEGYPFFYGKLTFDKLPLYTMDGVLRGENLTAMAYALPTSSPAGTPSDYYVDVCREGYSNFGFDPDGLDRAMRNTKRAMKAEQEQRSGKV